MADAVEFLRRYLGQRRELGERELFLGDLTRADLEALLAAAPPPTEASPPAAVEAPRRSEPLTPREILAGAPAPAVTAEVLVQLGSLDALREEALGCPRCRLAETRTQVVFGEGNPRAELLVVGEAPGAEEDRTGRPFVGAAGRLLDRLLLSAGFEREQVYICNVLKCRPPGNRNPLPEEVHACSPFLERQLELVAPRAILACGSFAAQTILRSQASIGKLRTERHTLGDRVVVATYHPAALLRNPGWIRPVWEDLQRLRASLDGEN